MLYNGLMNILAELFKSKARAELFRIFFGLNSGEYHLREIGRQSGLAIGSVQKEVENLVELAFIIRRVDGNRTYYRANQNHPLFSLFRELVVKTVGAGDLLKEAFANEKVDFLFIFGSIAAGEEKPESDVDLFVIGDIGLRAVSKLLQEPCGKIGREINPHVMSRAEFVKRMHEKDRFVTRVLESPILMIIGNENELRKLG